MNSAEHSPLPWTAYREPWMEGYILKDANGKEIGKIASFKDERKPNSFKLQPDLDKAKADIDLIVAATKQGWTPPDERPNRRQVYEFSKTIKKGINNLCL